MNQHPTAERMSPPVVPRQAATLVVVRDAPAGLEILLLRRAEKGDHNSGAWVFPGGLVDAGDRPCHPHCSGLDDATASARLGLAKGGLDYYVAAIRECFEEAGVLFAVDAAGQLVDMRGDTGARLEALRAPLHAGTCEFAQLCRDFGLRLAADRLFYIAHWVTPIGRAKRFDTRFFLAVLPPGQRSQHDAVETLEQEWLTPAAALSPENARKMMTPTRSVIDTIGRFPDTAALLAWARSPRQVAQVLPRLGMDRSGLRPVQRQDPAWAEVGHLQAQGQQVAWCELQPGVPVSLSPRVVRVSSADAAWNTYLVAAGDGWAVLDPAPGDASHVEALIAAAPGPIRWILPTQREPSAAAQALAARTGAQVPELGGDDIALPGDTRLVVLRDPAAPAVPAGYWLPAERMVFPGALPADPAALSALLAEEPEWIAPRQGFLAAGPRRGQGHAA